MKLLIIITLSLSLCGCSTEFIYRYTEYNRVRAKLIIGNAGLCYNVNNDSTKLCSRRPYGK